MKIIINREALLESLQKIIIGLLRLLGVSIEKGTKLKPNLILDI